MNDDVFTIRVDADDQPVQRPLRAMTVDEVAQTLEWHEQAAFEGHISREALDRLRDAVEVVLRQRIGERYHQPAYWESLTWRVRDYWPRAEYSVS